MMGRGTFRETHSRPGGIFYAPPMDHTAFISALMGTAIGSCIMLAVAILILPTAQQTVGEYMSRLAKRRWRKKR